jgi:hypothetical protein
MSEQERQWAKYVEETLRELEKMEQEVHEVNRQYHQRNSGVKTHKKKKQSKHRR